MPCQGKTYKTLITLVYGNFSSSTCLVTRIADTYANDDKCTKLLQELAISVDSNPHYKLTAGILRYKNRIVFRTSTGLKDKILASFHNSIFGG